MPDVGTRPMCRVPAPARRDALIRHTLCAVTMLGALACHSSTSSDDALKDSAFVQLTYSSMSLIAHPQSIRAGVPFDLVLRTFPADKCETVDRTVVSRNRNREYVIVPYNRIAANPDGTCAVPLPNTSHTVQLSYPTAGTKRVIVRGRDAISKEIVQIDLQLFVEP